MTMWISDEANIITEIVREILSIIKRGGVLLANPITIQTFLSLMLEFIWSLMLRDMIMDDKKAITTCRRRNDVSQFKPVIDY